MGLLFTGLHHLTKVTDLYKVKDREKKVLKNAGRCVESNGLMLRAMKYVV